MKVIQLVQTKDAAGSFNSNPYDLNDLKTFSIAVVFTGSDVAGTLQLQASLDAITYFDVPDSSQSVTGSAGHIWDVVTCGYRYVRVSWTYTSGTGNITETLFVKEPKVLYS